MRDRLTEITRSAIRAIGSFFATVRDAFSDWLHGGDMTVVVVLAVVAVVVLLVTVPNRRRY